jgi:hypothetical protein
MIEIEYNGKLTATEANPVEPFVMHFLLFLPELQLF